MSYADNFTKFIFDKFVVDATFLDGYTFVLRNGSIERYDLNVDLSTEELEQTKKVKELSISQYGTNIAAYKNWIVIYDIKEDGEVLCDFYTKELELTRTYTFDIVADLYTQINPDCELYNITHIKVHDRYTMIFYGYNTDEEMVAIKL